MDRQSVLPLVVRYRPKTFEELVGQQDQAAYLAKLVSNASPPPILIHGPPGTGKTTLARIFALARNCVSTGTRPCGSCPRCKVGLTPFEWHDFSGARWDEPEVAKDAEVLLRQVPWGNYGIFIDEVHGLQPRAADILLEEVERQRTGRYFICATTDLMAVRPALRSRCSIVTLKPIARSELIRLAMRICQEERFAYHPEALDLLATHARGSARELLLALDAVASRGQITLDNIKTALALDWTEDLVAYLRALLANDLGAQFAALSTWLASPGEKARSIREALLYVYNFEVSSPRIYDTVNPAFHLIEPSVRQQIAAGFASRARNERIDLASYWDSLLNFWMAP